MSDLSPLARLSGLTELDLSHCNRVAGLTDLVGLTGLRRLTLTGCVRVRDLTPLAQLTGLETLYLNHCKGVLDLTPLGGLVGLTRLNLSHCEVSDLTPLARLTGLTALDINRCRAVSDLKPLAVLTRLTELDLSYCKGVTDLSPLGGLDGLTRLNLTGCKAVSDLKPLARLSGLTALNLSWKAASDLKPLEGLTGLAVLNLAGNKAVSNLEPLASLTGLVELDLTGCEGVSDLTPLRQLTRLTRLTLYSCGGVSDLTPLSNLSGLTELDLSHCKGVSDLTPLLALDELEHLRIEGNGAALPEFLGNLNTAKSTQAWWRAERAALSRRRLLEVKLLIVGQGEVGKSHLRERLFGGDQRHYDPCPRSTDSFETVEQRWYVPDPADPSRRADVTVRVWDFGGQPELHSAHRFFLGTERCFYLLVLAAERPANGDGPTSNRLNYWLRLIAQYGTRPPAAGRPEPARAPVVIAVTRCDTPEARANLSDILQAIGDAGRVGYFGANVVAVVEGLGWSPALGAVEHEIDFSHFHACDLLSNAIADHLHLVPELWASVSEVYHVARRFVADAFSNGHDGWPMSRAYQAGGSLDRFTELFRGNVGATNEDQLVAFRNVCLGMLQHLGAVHWVAELVPTGPTTPWPVKDTAFNPEWVKWPVYDLLRLDKHACPRPGFVPNSKINSRLWTHGATLNGKDLYRQLPFAADDRHRVRALMTECRLAFEINDEENGLLVPDLLDAANLADDPPAGAWAYRVPFLPERVFLRYLAEVYLTQREPTDQYHRNRVVRTLAGRRVVVEARYCPPGRERPYLAIFPETGEPLHELAVANFRETIRRLFKSERFSLDGHHLEPVGERPVAGADQFMFLSHPLGQSGERTRPKYEFTIRFRGVDLASPQGNEPGRHPWTSQAGLRRLWQLVVKAGTHVGVDYLYRTENPAAERFALPTPHWRESAAQPAPARTTPGGKKLSGLKRRLAEQRRRLTELGQRLEDLHGERDPELVAETEQCQALIEKLDDEIRRGENPQRKSAMTAVQSSLQAAVAEVRGRLIACGFSEEADHFKECLSSHGRSYYFGYLNTAIPWRTQ